MIISRIGRRHLKIRLLVWLMYLFLLAGSITMVYPFLLMLSGSAKSPVDVPSMEIVPRFLISDTALYQKDVEAFFNESMGNMRQVFCKYVSTFAKLSPPEKINMRLVEEWRLFLSSQKIPFYYYSLGYIYASGGVMPHNFRKFKDSLCRASGGSIRKLNQQMDTEYSSWNEFRIPNTGCFSSRYSMPLGNAVEKEFIKFKERQPIEGRYYVILDGYYKYYFLMGRYGKDIDSYNKQHNTNYETWNDVKFSRTFPSKLSKLERQDWEIFVRMIISLLWINVDKTAAPCYHEYLRAKYKDIGYLNTTYASSYTSFEEVPFVKEPLAMNIMVSDWDYFIQGWKDPETGVKYGVPVGAITLNGPDFMFRDYLENKYGSIGKLNSELNLSCKSWDDIIPPQEEFHYTSVINTRASLRWEYLKRNYISVFEHILLHGNSLFNTILYCGLAVLSALIVNPLAAYALSRYKPPSTYKMLLFMMLTMAFPPMVTQIPAFLMLREFGLLNSFWALILPGLANGYSIFMLKGFFDALPQELYESATIDGAGEITIFMQITMSLSKPILAVIALGAFTGAYTNFMMALLVCQDQKMWTIMPWLYQLQQQSGQGIIFASLVVASIPTLIVFVICQNFIMKGIVVPVEK